MPLPIPQPPEFDVFINDSFKIINTDNSLTPVHNKKVLSLANDFEMGQWRYRKFHDFILDNIAETALSEKERRSLTRKGFTMLRESAKKPPSYRSEKIQKG